MNRFLRLRSSNLKLSVLFDQSRFISQSKPALAGFAKDYKPSSFPRNEAERVAAAKKYGMRPEDYEPMADDGLGFGDYPKLAPITPDMKSDWDEYDDQYLKRNFGEPILIGQEQLTAEKVSLKPLMVSFPKILFFFLLGGSVYFSLQYFFWDYKAFVPIAPKQYPRNAEQGEKHFKI